MFRKVTPIAVLFLLIGSARAATTNPSLDWIAGYWCVDLGEVIIEELWLPPHGGVAVGLGRTRASELTTSFDYFRIVDQDGTQIYIAQPGGQPPTTFGRTAGGEQWVRFENPDHDFPQSVEYRREGDALRAQIAGPDDNGENMVITFDYKSCDM